MNTIQAAYINALLADTAYVESIGLGDIDVARFEARLTPAQANYLAANFAVLSSIESPKALGSGFDAVVWQGKASTPHAGQVFVSMRGTQGVQDVNDDVQLASTGVPNAQIVDMVNWWLRISAPIANTDVPQIKYRLDAIVDPLTGVVLDPAGFALAAQTATGTGEVSATTSIAAVNGHSLGGYLATAFTRMFGAQAHVQHTSTFNSAGSSNLEVFRGRLGVCEPSNQSIFRSVA